MANLKLKFNYQVQLVINVTSRGDVPVQANLFMFLIFAARQLQRFMGPGNGSGRMKRNETAVLVLEKFF